MTTKLKSNWMGNSNAAPVKYRAASKGKVFTRTEKLAMIEKQAKAKQAMATLKEMVLKARNEAKADSDKRKSFFNGLHVLAENPQSKVQRSKQGLFIQPRVNGAFGKKISL